MMNSFFAEISDTVDPFVSISSTDEKVLPVDELRVALISVTCRYNEDQ